MNTLFATNSHLPLFEVISPDPYPFECSGSRSDNPCCCGVSLFQPRDGFSMDSNDYPSFINGLHERMSSSPVSTLLMPYDTNLPFYRKCSALVWKNLETGEKVSYASIPQNNTYFVKGKGK